MTVIDWDVAADDLASRGWALVRGLLPSWFISGMQKRVTDRLRTTGVTAGTISTNGELSYMPREDESPLDLLLAEATRWEGIEECFQAQELIRGIERVIGGGPVFSHPSKYLRAVLPQTSRLAYPAGVHQDYPEFQGSPRQVTMWAPIFRVTDETGALPVFDRERDSAVLPMRIADNPSGWEIRPDALGRRHAFDMKPGDVLIFNTFTAHGGAVNQGTGIRVSIESRYQPIDDPISTIFLERPILDDAWETHYADWQNGFQYYWHDRQPKTSSFTDTWERWRDLEAIAEGAKGNYDAWRALQIACEFARDPAIKRSAQIMLDRLVAAAG